MPFEILHFPLMLLGRGPAFERPQVAASTGAGILLSRVQAILAGCQFPDHGAHLRPDFGAIFAPETVAARLPFSPGVDGICQTRRLNVRVARRLHHCFASLSGNEPQRLEQKYVKLARPR
jgi:hypothetical protein